MHVVPDLNPVLLCLLMSVHSVMFKVYMHASVDRKSATEGGRWSVQGLLGR